MKAIHFVTICVLLVACSPAPAQLTATAVVAQEQTQTAAPTQTPTRTPTLTSTPTATPLPTLTPTPTELPLPADLTFVYGDGVTQAERDEFRRGIALAIRELGLSKVKTIYVFDQLEQIMEAQSQYLDEPITDQMRSDWVNLVSNTVPYPGIILFYLGADWRQFSEMRHFRTIIHEYYHTIQQDLAGGSKTNLTILPQWLREGSAEYLTFKVLANNGYADAVTADRQERLEWIRIQRPQLSALEPITVGIENFFLGYLVAESLAKTYGDQSIDAYWRAQKDTTDWKTAFQTTFGVPVETFYQDFDEYLVEQYTLRISGKVTDPNGVPLGGIFVKACPQQGECEDPGIRLYPSTARTARDGTYTLLFTTEGDYIVQFGVSAEKPTGYYSLTGLTPDIKKAEVLKVSVGPVSDIDAQMAVEKATSANRFYISGFVTDAAGAPFVGLSVFACPLPAGSQSCIGTNVSGNGSYVIAVPDNVKYVMVFVNHPRNDVNYCYTPGGVNVAGTPAMWNGVQCTQLEINGSNLGGINVQLPVLISQTLP